jgi:hypothetical protein
MRERATLSEGIGAAAAADWRWIVHQAAITANAVYWASFLLPGTNVTAAAILNEQRSSPRRAVL